MCLKRYRHRKRGGFSARRQRIDGSIPAKRCLNNVIYRDRSQFADEPFVSVSQACHCAVCPQHHSMDQTWKLGQLQIRQGGDGGKRRREQGDILLNLRGGGEM
ncbi:hypothetical protein ILYODFUR_022277 [Ilyodon furcidens]|uniref:Uncharacterized protein n=1 Tax=Ilyodon furcidens TaxID=33524 RepID=A0ABV0TAK8_9TELE